MNNLKITRPRKYRITDIHDLDLIGYIPSPELQHTARKRTGDLILAFMRAGSKADHLDRLVSSAYLQGARDMADACVMKGKST